MESEIALFASACEAMNTFARSLRDLALFTTVRTGADIRYYQSGWRLEKWVEGEIRETPNLWAAWWLELGGSDGDWLVQSHLSIDPEVLFISLPDRCARSLKELEENLSVAVNELTHALEINQEFANHIEAAQRSD